MLALSRKLFAVRLKTYEPGCEVAHSGDTSPE